MGTTDISTDGSTVTMIYDALDRMVEQTRSTGHTEIVYGPYGMKLALMNGQSLVSAFVKIPGGGRAVYTSTGLTYYRHADHLGSSRLATKTTKGQRWYQSAYAPYGEDYAQAGDHPDLAFTDENQDTVAGGWATNLYDFMLREYRTAHGRWTSPDPAGLGAVDPANPQSWNRYAYVLNNPTAMVDLLGDGADDLDDGVYLDETIVNTPPFAALMLGGPAGSASFNDGPDPNPPTPGCVSSDPSCLGSTAPPVVAGVPGGGSTGSSAANTGIPVHRTFQRTFQCSSTASGVMNALESNFASFANNPASGKLSTFAIFTPGPASPGRQIGINVGVQAGGHTFGYSDVSVTVQSASSSQLVFQSDPGHVLYPATVSFSASDAGNGSITFTTSVSATTNGLWGTAQFYLFGGRAGETSTWNNLLNNVAGFCAQPSHP